jgi:hypothetical protein
MKIYKENIDVWGLAELKSAIFFSPLIANPLTAS